MAIGSGSPSANLRAEWARTETAITAAARRAGLPGAQIEASLESGGSR
jgi:hypothetical protein